MMLESLFRGVAAEKVLLYLENYNEGYAKEISETFSLELSAIQRQLEKFEKANILVSQKKGRTRMFYWNPRYPFQKELRALLAKALSFLPEAEIRKHYRKRMRPRKTGKPL